jgi:hypothetical protein
MIHARKVYIDKDADIKYYQIYLGKQRIAEYVAEIWADKLVAGYNMLVDKNNEELLIKKQLRENNNVNIRPSLQ